MGLRASGLFRRPGEGDRGTAGDWTAVLSFRPVQQPDAFAEGWEETMDEVERVLAEVEAGGPPA